MTTHTSNLHQQILNKFLNSNIKIKSLDRLNEYILYCIENNQNEPIKGKTSYHHILPKADSCFPEFKNLKVNKWNGTHLYYSEHYYAHWLLTEAISNYGQLEAFCKMHNMDIKLGRIIESDLISPEEFQEKMEERSVEHSQWYRDNPEKVKERNNKRLISMKKTDENGVSIFEKTGKKISTTKSSKKWKDEVGNNAVKNRLQKMSELNENGESMFDISAKKANNTKRQVDENGVSIFEKTGKKISTTKSSKKWKDEVGVEQRKKQSNTLNSKEWIESVGIEKVKKIKESKKQNSIKKYGLYDVYTDTNLLLYTNLIRLEVAKISEPLLKTSKEKPLGSTIQSKTNLIRLNKSHLIGYYVINKS